MAQEIMYPGIANSPQTELASGIDDTQTTIPLVDASVLPAAPNLATIGTGEDAETILYTGVDGNDLTGVTRGFEGAAKSWSAGSKVARNFTAYDHTAFKGNIEDHEARINAHLADYEQHIEAKATDASPPHGMGKAAAQDYEIGNWTPVLRGSTVAGSNTYTLQRGRYTKVGKLVTVSFAVVLIEKDASMTGNTWIAGLPFMVREIDFGVAFGRYEQIAFPAGRNQLVGRCVQDNNIIALTASGDNITRANITVTNITDNTEVVGTATYLTD